MSNATTGPKPGAVTTGAAGTAPAAKKETVFGGPTSAPSGGTVYNGPAAGGTVYQGPGLNGAAAAPQRAGNVARNTGAAPKTGGARGGVIFFTIAALSALNTLLIVAKAPFVLARGLAITRMQPNGALGPFLVVNVIAIGLFVALGIFAGKGSKTAVIAGLLLYAGDTALLLLSPNAAAHASSIFFHALFLFYIVKALRQIEN
jgi:hypothetical protein